jgi:hypothetical protein
MITYACRINLGDLKIFAPLYNRQKMCQLKVLDQRVKLLILKAMFISLQDVLKIEVVLMSAFFTI